MQTNQDRVYIWKRVDGDRLWHIPCHHIYQCKSIGGHAYVSSSKLLWTLMSLQFEFLTITHLLGASIPKAFKDPVQNLIGLFGARFTIFSMWRGHFWVYFILSRIFKVSFGARIQSETRNFNNLKLWTLAMKYRNDVRFQLLHNWFTEVILN